VSHTFQWRDQLTRGLGTIKLGSVGQRLSVGPDLVDGRLPSPVRHGFGEIKKKK
jgi:hypothetical protein